MLRERDIAFEFMILYIYAILCAKWPFAFEQYAIKAQLSSRIFQPSNTRVQNSPNVTWSHTTGNYIYPRRWLVHVGAGDYKRWLLSSPNQKTCTCRHGAHFLESWSFVYNGTRVKFLGTRSLVFDNTWSQYIRWPLFSFRFNYNHPFLISTNYSAPHGWGVLHISV